MRHEILTEAETPAFAARGVKPLVLLGADMLAAIIAFLGALLASNLLRALVGLGPIATDSDGFRLHLLIVGALTGALFIWFHSRGQYRRRQALADQLGPILGGAFIAALAAATIQFATIEVGSRLLTLTYWLLLAPALILTRLLARQTLRAAKDSSAHHKLEAAVTALEAQTDRLAALALALGFEVPLAPGGR